eukprot:TRINITY_DN4093_c0_g1_i1.p1 TRINITY_DN4093_c0_g1~~TRINITY_DN4093_c0_g1_i1.p1  ORF type:complete len:468 (+),score=103.35 TRINITY_DN4093_c0_g1_i1:118-1521(+)
MKHKFNKGGPFSEIKGTYNVVKTNDGQQESLSNPTKTFKCLVYSSPSRNFCQTICGWGFRNNDYFGEYMSKLEDRGEYSKAAALSLFHFQTQRAMSNLKNQAETSSTENWNAQLVAMALAGYQDAVQSGVSNSDVWRKTCKSLSNQIPDPYFRAMVLFLLQIDMFNTSTATTSTSSSSSTLSDSNIEQPKSHHVDDSSNQEMLFQEILDPKLEISLFDKIAFACRFLKYDQLMKFLHETQERVIAAGDLDGLIITGIDETGKGIDLLRSYLCKTGDIQTAAILAGLVSKRKIKSPCLDEWIMLYRELLDRWQLWNERALFDVDRVPHHDVPNNVHVYMHCRFCGHSLTLNRDASSRRGRILGRGMGSDSHSSQADYKHQSSFCPSCTKPLPRCAVCLLPFSCTPFDPRNVKTGIETHFWASTNAQFEEWFSWCQTCKHGGHVSHMEEWFSTHNECPVSDCNCLCSTL